MTEVIKNHWLWFLIILSIIALIASVVSVSVLLISLPSDYFTRKKRVSRIKNPVLRLFLCFLKNMCGGILIILGILLSLPGVPGPGILTLLIGLIISDFPGKRRIERKLIERPLVLSMTNRIRARYKRPLIVLED